MQAVIVDDPSMAQLYQSMSNRLNLGFRVFMSTDETIRAAQIDKEQGIEWNLAILDYRIDNRNGDQLGQILRNLFPSIFLVLNTSLAPLHFNLNLWAEVLEMKIATLRELQRVFDSFVANKQ